MSKKLYLSFIALLSIAVTFTSCSKKDEVTGTGYIRVTNASETASPIDFYLDNTKENTTALAYNQSTDYFPITTASHPTIIKSSASGATVTAFNTKLQDGAYWNVFYFGGNTVAYPDDLTAPQPGKARVRFINLNLELTGNVDFGITGGAKVVSALISKLNSDYVDVAPASTFSLYTAGTNTQLLSIPTTIEAGHIYTIYLSGSAQASLVANVLLQK